ncbi:MAG: hypothetical protein WAX44_03730 [Minisyncoccia bacterium]
MGLGGIMSKRRPGEIYVPSLKLTPKLMAKIEKIAEKNRKEEERRKKQEERDVHRKDIQGGVRLGLTVRQILWLDRRYARKYHEHWNGRVG